MATEIPKQYNLTSSLSVLPSGLGKLSKLQQQELNESVFQAAKNKAAASITSLNLTKSTNKMNTIATVGVLASMGIALSGFVASILPKKSTAANQGGQQQATAPNATITGLKTAMADAAKSHDFSGLQSEVGKAYTDLATKQTELETAGSKTTTAQGLVDKDNKFIAATLGDINKADDDIKTQKGTLSQAAQDVHAAKMAYGNLPSTATTEEKAAALQNVTDAEKAEKAAQGAVDKAEAHKVELETTLDGAKASLQKAEQASKDATKFKENIEVAIRDITKTIANANAVLAKRDMDVKAPKVDAAKTEPTESEAPVVEETSTEVKPGSKKKTNVADK